MVIYQQVFGSKITNSLLIAFAGTWNGYFQLHNMFITKIPATVKRTLSNNNKRSVTVFNYYPNTS